MRSQPDTSLQALMRRWDSEGLKLLPPESPEAVEAAFGRLCSRATRDVIALFATFGGMDNGFLQLWSLQEMEDDENNATRSMIGRESDQQLIASDLLLDEARFCRDVRRSLDDSA